MLRCISVVGKNKFDMGLNNMKFLTKAIGVTILLSATSVYAESYSIIGNTIIGSDGTSYNRIGNATIGSDGSSWSTIGNTTIGSDGSSWSRIGNTYIGSDGSSCNVIGSSVICN